MRNLIAIFLVLLSLSCAGSRVDPNDTNDLIGAGTAELENQNFDDDDEMVSEARYYYLRGQLALAIEDLPTAERYLSKAAELEHAAAPSLRNSLAFMYVRAAKYNEALKAVNDGLKKEPKNAELLQTKAAVYAAAKKYDEAIATLKEIESPPAERLEEYYNFLSTLYIQKGDIHGAQETLATLVSKKPDSFIAHYQLGRIYEASGNPARAELEYSKALEINSDQRAVLVDLARTLIAQKKFKEAETSLNRGLAKDPTDAALHNAKVQLYLVQQKLDAAIEQLRALAKIEPESIQSRTRIAIILIDQKKYKEAIALLKQLIAEKPEQTTLNYYLASALGNAKRMDEAKEALKLIPPSSQLYVESRLMGATIEQQQRDIDGALAFIDEGLASRPDNTQLLTFKAQLKREQGDKQAALDIQQRLVNLEPKEEKHKFLFAVYLDELNRKPEAIVVLRTLIQENPNSATALNYLGYSLVETEGSDLNEAEQLIKRAIAIEPTNGYYVDSLGWLYFKQKRYADAERQLALAVKYVPDDAVIIEHYARALIEVGKTAEAKRSIDRAKKFASKSDDKQVGSRLQELSQSLGAK